MLRLNLAEGSRAQKSSALIAVTSPVGSTGKTTVAINLAAELAKTRARVLLVDLDLMGPSISAQLGLQESAPGLLAASRLALQQRLTEAELNRLCVDLSSFDFSVLPSQGSLAKRKELTASSVGEIMRVAKESFDFVIADLGSGCFDALTNTEVYKEVLALSEHTIIVALGEPVGIYRLLQQEAELIQFSASPKLLINRVRNSVIPKARAEITVTLERLSKLEIRSLLPDDPSAIDQATKQAAPVSALGKSSTFRQALAGFARAEILKTRSPLDARLAKLG